MNVYGVDYKCVRYGLSLCTVWVMIVYGVGYECGPCGFLRRRTSQHGKPEISFYNFYGRLLEPRKIQHLGHITLLLSHI